MSSLQPRLSPRLLPRTRSLPQLKQPQSKQRPRVLWKTSQAPSRKPILSSSKKLIFHSHLNFKVQCKYFGTHVGLLYTLPSIPLIPSSSSLSLSFSPVSPSPWPMPSTPSATPPSFVGCRALGATARKRRRLRPSATSENPLRAFFLIRRGHTCQSVPLAPPPPVLLYCSNDLIDIKCEPVWD